jgi:phosphoribosylamine--glycine ligase
MDSIVFHAGTKRSEGMVVTSGGRVLAVTSWGKSMREALGISYRNAGVLNFEGIFYRTDIGFDL